MSSRLQIPVSARVVQEFTDIIPIGQYAGNRVYIRLWGGDASKGYKSNYKMVPHLWLEYICPGHFRLAYGYSGRRLQQAYAGFAENVKMLQEAKKTA